MWDINIHQLSGVSSVFGYNPQGLVVFTSSNFSEVRAHTHQMLRLCVTLWGGGSREGNADVLTNMTSSVWDTFPPLQLAGLTSSWKGRDNGFFEENCIAV